jgi:hypothetical protein
LHDGRVTRAPEEPFLVTSAGKSPREEQRERQRRYLVTMALRVACFILAIVLVALGVPWEFSALAIAASLILPWVAVVAANAGPTRTVDRPALYQREPPKEIGGRRD